MTNAYDVSIRFEGTEELIADLDKLGPKVSTRLQKTGMRKAAMRYRTFLRQQSRMFKRSGTLTKDIGYKKVGRGYRVGVMNRFYYNILEYDYTSTSGRGEEHPWFEEASRQFAPSATGIMLEETRKALDIEKGKMAVRSRQRLKRRR